MTNPTKEANYTTIFADGSVILENPWLIRPDGTGKWYWNEEPRGGVVAWNEIPEGGYKYHKYYKLPDWELRDLVIQSLTLEALSEAGIDNWEWYNQAIKDYCDYFHVNSIEELAERDLTEAYYKGYEIC